MAPRILTLNPNMYFPLRNLSTNLQKEQLFVKGFLIYSLFHEEANSQKIMQTWVWKIMCYVIPIQDLTFGTLFWLSFGTLLSLCHPKFSFSTLKLGQVFWMWFKKCSLYSRRASNQEFVILGVHINETCYKTGCVSTRDFTVIQIFLGKITCLTCFESATK